MPGAGESPNTGQKELMWPDETYGAIRLALNQRAG
jgi:hypothetical protein